MKNFIFLLDLHVFHLFCCSCLLKLPQTLRLLDHLFSDFLELFYTLLDLLFHCISKPLIQSLSILWDLIKLLLSLFQFLLELLFVLNVLWLKLSNPDVKLIPCFRINYDMPFDVTEIIAHSLYVLLKHCIVLKLLTVHESLDKLFWASLHNILLLIQPRLWVLFLLACQQLYELEIYLLINKN